MTPGPRVTFRLGRLYNERMIGRTATVIAYLLWLPILFFGGLKLVDMAFLDDPKVRLGTIGDPNASGGRDAHTPHRTVNTFDLYPWTGGHTQSNAVTNPLFRTGDHGFFIDFDLDDPPPKQSGELRLIIVGGSAAVGWGADTNDAMMYRVLERLFSAQKPCGPGTTLRVINLAMGGSVTYQNYLALNLWGHALAPDMILSFSGHNDMDAVRPPFSYVYRGFSTVRGLTFAARRDTGPRWLRFFANIYPGLMENTIIGTTLRTLTLARLEQDAEADYLRNFPPAPKDARQALDRIVVPMYVHALRSIKRDFSGIPIFVAYQPYMATDADPHQSAPKTPLTRTEWIGLFEELIARSRSALDGHLNAEWRFFDAHRYYLDKMERRYPPGDGVHLDAAKQKEMAGVIAGQLFPWICETASRR